MSELKAAARAVILYPAGHPAIVAMLGRIVQVTSDANLPAPLRLTVLPEALLLDEHAPARTDAAATARKSASPTIDMRTSG